MKIKMGPNAPPLHEQLGVSSEVVRKEQILLDLITQANQIGTSAAFTRQEHKKILDSLQEKGLLKQKGR